MLMKVKRFISIINPFLDGITSVAVTSDSKYIISGSYDKSIKVFDLQTKQQVHHFENAHEGTEISRPIINQSWDFISSMTVTSDNIYIISGSYDGSIKVFDLQTKQLVHHFENAQQCKEIYLDS